MVEQSAAESLSTVQASGRPSHSQMNVYDDTISKSGSLAKRPRKNVTFQAQQSDRSPASATPSSRHGRQNQMDSSLSRSGRKAPPEVEIEESIDESIPDGGSSLHETSASKLKDSALSSSKMSRRSGKGKGVKS